MDVTYKDDMYEYTHPEKIIEDDMGIKHDETWQHFILRVVNCANQLEEEVKKYDDKTVFILFGHSLYFSILMSYIVTKDNIDNIDNCFELPNCSINSIVYREDKKKWRICHTSSIAHLGQYATGYHNSFCLQ